MTTLPVSSQVCPAPIDGKHPGGQRLDTCVKVIAAVVPQVVTEH